MNKNDTLIMTIGAVMAIFIMACTVVITEYIEAKSEFTCEEIKKGVWFGQFGDCQ